jgi:hypothetical protein
VRSFRNKNLAQDAPDAYEFVNPETGEAEYAVDDSHPDFEWNKPTVAPGSPGGPSAVNPPESTPPPARVKPPVDTDPKPRRPKPGDDDEAMEDYERRLREWEDRHKGKTQSSVISAASKLRSFS